MSEEGYKNIIKTYEIETEQLYKEISELQNNWKELKEWLENTIEQYGGWAKYRFECVYNKMQEIERITR